MTPNPSTEEVVGLVEKLRAPSPSYCHCAEAADEIERLTADNARLRAALQPFAAIAATQPIGYYVAKADDQRMVLLFDDGSKDAERAPATVMVSAFREAARALLPVAEGG